VNDEAWYVETLTSSAVTQEASGTEDLARFFPGVERVQIRAVLQPTQNGGGLRETVTVEYAGMEHAIFVSALPLEFGDRIQLHFAGSKRKSEARVTAVQYHQSRKAVAVQFLNAETSWVNRP
jgi:hypothetical protein